VPSVVLIVPGHLDTATGGYGYDRRMVAGLRSRGWSVQVIELDDSFPAPTAVARAAAADTLAAIRDGETVLVDGLAFGVLGVEAEREAARLRLVALVHHPLADETGLPADTARALEASERHALRSARLVVVTSQATARGLNAYGVERGRIVVIEPGTDRRPLPVGTPAAPTGIVELLCVAAIVPRKGHDVLLRALALIRDLPWRLTCVGSLERDPAMIATLRQLIGDLALTDRVRLVGEARGETLETYYASADVFVLPTLHEGYGMVVAEALTAGLPVVATPTGGIPDLVEGEAGLLVPIGDHAALASAIASVVTDAALRARLAAGARQARSRIPTWDASVGKLVDALISVARVG
jgi:glycosyltransferase involved in cell wall biosynthesis